MPNARRYRRTCRKPEGRDLGTRVPLGPAARLSRTLAEALGSCTQTGVVPQTRSLTECVCRERHPAVSAVWSCPCTSARAAFAPSACPPSMAVRTELYGMTRDLVLSPTHCLSPSLSPAICLCVHLSVHHLSVTCCLPLRPSVSPSRLSVQRDLMRPLPQGPAPGAIRGAVW